MVLKTIQRKTKYMLKGQRIIQQNTQENISKVWYYIVKHTNKQRKIIRNGVLMEIRLDTRPVQMKILWIAKATGLTYPQVRRALDILELNGLIHKYVNKHPTKFKDMWIQRVDNRKFLFR